MTVRESSPSTSLKRRVRNLEEELSELPAKLQKAQEKELRKLKKARKALEREVAKVENQSEQRFRRTEKGEIRAKSEPKMLGIVSVLCLLTFEAYFLFTAASSTIKHSASLQIPQDHDPRPRLVTMAVPDAKTVYGFRVRGSHVMKGQQFTLPKNRHRRRVLFEVSMIVPDSVAEKAGLRKGDRFLKINEINVHDANFETVLSLIDQYPTRVTILVVSTSKEHVDKMMAGAILGPYLEKSILDEQVANCRESLRCSIAPWIVVVLHGVCTMGIGAAVVFPRYARIMMFPSATRVNYDIFVAGGLIVDFIGKFSRGAPSENLLKWLKVFTENFPAQLKEMLCYTDNRWLEEELHSRLVTASLVAVFFVCLQKMVQVWLIITCLRFFVSQNKIESPSSAKSSEPDDCNQNDCVVSKVAAQQQASIDMPDE